MMSRDSKRIRGGHMNRDLTLSEIRIRSFLVSLALILLPIIASGCDSLKPEPKETPPPTIDVSPIFLAFYEYLGGQPVFGKAISPQLEEGSKIVQWLETGKMVYDPEGPDFQKFSFAPLGKDMGVETPAVPPPTQPELRYVGGHIIHPDFWLLYEILGANIVGNPLSEARYNPIRRRYEQFFENLGFYRLAGQSNIYLLQYGEWACGDVCRPYQSHAEAPINSSPGEIDVSGAVNPAFVEVVGVIGQDLTGSNLTDAYTREGKLEQVFENVVLLTDDITESSNVRLRPLPSELNVIPDSPKPASGTPNMQFVATAGELGYEVPGYFWDYIYAHGGIQVSGPPITHLSQIDPRTYRQCFENMCLIFVPDEIEGLRIRPEALGYVYRLLYPPPSPAPFATPVPAKEVVTIKIWESFPAVPSAQPQEIGAILFSDSTPYSDVALELMVILENGTRQYFTMPATDKNGRTSILLPPIVAPNGTLIEYQVCMPQSAQFKFCVGDSFMIWSE